VLDNLAAEVGKDYGDFDLICHIAYDQPPLTRQGAGQQGQEAQLLHQIRRTGPRRADRAARQIRRRRHQHHRKRQGPRLEPFSDMGTPWKSSRVFGGKDQYETAIQELEQELYKQEQSA
jgi:type I restriction enzyme, R subunit